ncbi:MAG: hypothetical protein WC346_11685 [Methanogenium sp.]|jgi:hypothetical protein
MTEADKTAFKSHINKEAQYLIEELSTIIDRYSEDQNLSINQEEEDEMNEYFNNTLKYYGINIE